MGLPAAVRVALDAPIPGLRPARELVRDREERERAGETLATGTPLDRLLAGGLRRGEMVELVGERSSGRFSLVVATLAAVTAAGEAAALVDLGDGLDPRAAATAGVDLARLLWARPRTRKEAMMATEAILAAALPLVVVELGLPPLPGGRGVEASWLRLARAAREQRTALLVASPYRVSGTAAAAVVEAARPRPDWRGAAGRGNAPAPRVLHGLAARLALIKDRRAGLPDHPPEPLALHLPEAVATG